MRRIQIAVAQSVLSAPPQALSFIRKKFVAKIVNVRSFAIEQIAKFASMNHAENERLVVAVAAVLKHEAVFARLFGYSEDLPAIFERSNAGHLHGHVFSVLHRGDGHLRMPTPRSGHKDQVNVFLGKQIFEVVWTTGV